ncbi:MAG: polysaccharide deacetylase family protein [Cyclobacteriaceae bacterium]|nr:polysaccharide deacetylase family protein [Cyclobacteriaceae bacterium]
MRYFFYKTPSWLRRWYPQFVWKIDENDPVIYLTFDDGPVPGATPYVLDILDQYQARATFFVVGDNVRKHPSLFREVLTRGHAVGNHTYHHLKGWSVSAQLYADDIARCRQVMEDEGAILGSTPLFRPPYGRITTQQARQVVQGHRVIMWDILSGDFDLSLNVDSSFRALKKAEQGSVIVFHDSEKYLMNVKKLLPALLADFSSRGYKFNALSDVLYDH